MARPAAKIEKEISRLEEIESRLAHDEDEANRKLAELSAAMVPAMAKDDSAEADRIEREAQAADSKRTSAARRRDSVRQAIGLMKDELEAVRTGDTIRAARRRFDAEESRFDAFRRELHDGIKQASTALGGMHLAHAGAQAAADELVELGEERPGLYAYPVKWAGVNLQRLRDEATEQALIAAQASSPEFRWAVEIGAAVPTVS